MLEFIIVIIQYVIKMLVLAGIAVLGGYIGYWIRNRNTIRTIKYFKKQREKIARNGKLIAYMNRHYWAIYGVITWKRKKNRNEEWLYKKCYTYASKCEKWEINSAKAYFKKDLQSMEIIAMLIAICSAMVSIAVTPISSWLIVLFCIWIISKLRYPNGKQAYLVSVLEDVINDNKNT